MRTTERATSFIDHDVRLCHLIDEFFAESDYAIQAVHNGATGLARATRAWGKVREAARLRSWVCSSGVRVREGLGRPVIMHGAYPKTDTYACYLLDTILVTSATPASALG